jgi:hypothetical protein
MRLWHQHPVVSQHFAAPASGAMKISDFLSDRQWRRTELFRDCYGAGLGIGWEIATQIRFAPTVQVCAALGRTNRDFGERERAFLDVVNPHLRAAYARRQGARRGCDRADDPAALVRQSPRLGGPAERGRVLASGTSRFSRPVPARPEERRSPPAPAPASRPRRGCDPDLRAPRGTSRTRPPGPPAADQPARGRGAGAARPRPYQRLDRGRARPSPNTVGRYVERVYAKLDVHSRVAATAAVRDALTD